MLRWKATNPNSGVPVIGFGIDAENVRRLQAGQPIVVKASVDGKIFQVVIHYGESSAEMAREFSVKKRDALVVPQPLDEENVH